MLLGSSALIVDMTLSTSVLDDRLVKIEAIEISDSLKCEGALFLGSGIECLTAETIKYC